MEPVEPLSAEARACLDAFRRQVPSEAAAEEGWRSLRATIGSGSRASAVDRSATNVRRLVIAAAVTLAAAAAVLVFVRAAMQGSLERSEADVGRSEALDQVGVPTQHRAIRSSGAAERVEEASLDPEPIATPTIGASEPPSRPTASRRLPSASTDESTSTQPRPQERVDATSSAADLAEETRLIGLARGALTRGQPDEAVEHLELHAERFPQGAFLEERMAYLAIARCQTNGGLVAADAFRRRWPRSPHRRRVDNACESGKDFSTDPRAQPEESEEALR